MLAPTTRFCKPAFLGGFAATYLATFNCWLIQAKRALIASIGVRGACAASFFIVAVQLPLVMITVRASF